MRHNKRPSHEIKILALNAYLSDNISPKEIAEIHGVHFTTVYKWIEKYKENESFDSLKRDHKGGAQPKIDSKSSKKLLKMILKPATAFGYEDGLWTTKRIKSLCLDKLKIDISHVGVWRFLKRFNFSYKKAEKQYLEANEDELNSWLNNDFPEIIEKARKQKGIMYFLDESNIQLSAFNGMTWAPIGVRPIIKVSGKRDSVSAISAISKSGFLVFNLWDCMIDSDVVINFLTQMLQFHKRCHLYIFMDNSPVHKSKKIVEFEFENKRLHIKYLPKYWPKYNPDEFVWNHLKHQEIKTYSFKEKKTLMNFISKKLNSMSSNSKLIKGIFMRCPLANHM